ncbi:MAG TPA: nuclear transport factor 2 family protein [Aquihabitans sp.]|jgi:ketosteroid isomerase-like protein|nr:nuclear transport factor 2 family protein [Aquihabitans sp.]
MSDDALAETIDHVAITRLQQAYADAITRRDWPALVPLFADGAVVELDLVARPPRRFEGVEAFTSFVADAIARYEHFQFVVLGTHVDLWPGGDRDAAEARIYMAEIRQETREAGRDDAHGLYRDRYERIDGRWRFAHRRYRSMARFPGGDVFPLPDLA